MSGISTGGWLLLGALLASTADGPGGAAPPAAEPLRAVIVEPPQVGEESVLGWRGQGFRAVAVVLDERHTTADFEAAARAAASGGLELYYWIEVGRNPAMAAEHPRWMASLGVHDDWRRRFPGSPPPAKGEVAKAFPWVPIGYREAFDAHLARVKRLLDRAAGDFRGVLLNDLQGGPASCGCGNLQCRWALDYGVPSTAAVVEGGAAARFVTEVKKVAGARDVVPVWTTECQDDDLPPDRRPGASTTGLCGTVGCAQGTCPEAFRREWSSLLSAHSGPIGLLALEKELERDRREYGGPGGWIQEPVRSLDRVSTPAIPHRRLWTIVQGYGLPEDEVAKAIRAAAATGAGAVLLARARIDQSYEPRVIKAGAAEDLPIPSMPFLRKKAPPLPPPRGPVVEVGSVEELFRASGGAAEGTTILIADGEYFLPDLLRLRGLRDVTLRGRSGDRDRVVLDGSRSKSRELVWIEGSEGVTVADLTIRNAPVHALTVKGESNVRRVMVHNCRFLNFWERGIKGTAPYGKDGKMATAAGDEAALKVRPADGTIRFCLFRNDHPKVETDWTGGDYIGGIDMMWLRGWTIADNVFIGIQGRNRQGRGAIFIWNNSEDVVVERNLVVDCDTGIAFGNPSGGARHMTRGVLRANFIVRGSYKAVELARAADCTVHNNSLWSEDADWDRTFHVFQGAGGTKVFSNLVRGKLLVEDPGCEVKGNLAGALERFFVSPREGDLHLSAIGAEACAGKGLPVPPDSLDFDGEPRAGAPDIGADQTAGTRRAAPPPAEGRKESPPERRG